MIKSLIWNIRGIKSQGAFDRLMQLKRAHNLIFIAVMEPFCRRSKLDRFRRRLGFDFAHANSNNKIWLFSDMAINCTVIEDLDQHVTCSINNNGDSMYITIVYAKCHVHLREELWDNIKNFAEGNTSPWMVVGDFNFIIDLEENKGGVAHNILRAWHLSIASWIVD